jgi:hypothetical protein
VESLPEFKASKRDKLTDGWDLCNDDDLAAIVRLIDQGVIWIHGAPPCSTFSRARRSDHHGSCRVLRTEDAVYGFGDPDAEEANTLAIRMFALAEQQHHKGRFFSIENPWESLMWSLKEAQRVEKLPGVVRCFINQCAYGSPFKKDTAILTNAPWLIGKERVCADVAPHKHVPLVGRVWSYAENKEIWYTAEAAEYPSGMCEVFTNDFASWFRQNSMGNMTRVGAADGSDPTDDPEYVRVGRFGNCLCKADLVHETRVPRNAVELSKREHREAENKACIGGMRSPHRAVARSRELRALGRNIRGVLCEVLGEFPKFERLVDLLRAAPEHPLRQNPMYLISLLAQPSQPAPRGPK